MSVPSSVSDHLPPSLPSSPSPAYFSPSPPPSTASGSMLSSTPSHPRPDAHGQIPPVSTISLALAGPRFAQRTSCSFCRQRKRRCDQLRPTCSNCRGRGLECHYFDEKLGDVSDPPPAVAPLVPSPASSGPVYCQFKAGRRKRSHDLSDNPHNSHGHMSSNHSDDSYSSGDSSKARLIQDVSRLTPVNQVFHAASRMRNQTYLTSYFTLINAALYTFLDEKEFMKEFEERSTNPAALVLAANDPTQSEVHSFLLRACGCLAIGARMFGDLSYSELCNSIARDCASKLFNSVADLGAQRVVLAFRGLLILSYYCIGMNCMSSVASYLAVCYRLNELPLIRSSIPPLVSLYASLLANCMTIMSICSTMGLDFIPPQGYAIEQDAQYPIDKLKYLKMKRTILQVDNSDEEFMLLREFDHQVNIDAELDTTNLRGEMIGELWNMVKSITSGSAPSCSIYSLLMVCLKAEVSPVVPIKIRAQAIGHKLISLVLLGKHSLACRAARQFLDLSQTIDQSHHIFNSVMISFAVLSLLQWEALSDTEEYIGIGLEMLEQVAARWPAAAAIFQNITRRVEESAYKATQEALQAAREIQDAVHFRMDNSTFQPVQQMSAGDSETASLIFSSISSNTEQIKRRQEKLLAQTAAAGQRAAKPSAQAARFQSLIQTIAQQADEISGQFKSTLKLDADPLALPILTQPSSQSNLATSQIEPQSQPQLTQPSPVPMKHPPAYSFGHSLESSVTPNFGSDVASPLDPIGSLFDWSFRPESAASLAHDLQSAHTHSDCLCDHSASPTSPLPSAAFNDVDRFFA